MQTPKLTTLAAIFASTLAIALSAQTPQNSAAPPFVDSPDIPGPEWVVAPGATMGDAAPAARSASTTGDLAREATSSLTSAVGANFDAEGNPWAGGPSVDATFRNGTACIVTPHSDDAQRTFDWRYTFESYGRGESLEAIGSGDESIANATVTFARPGVDEVYEARVDGLKQSFVFHQLPPGTGDLIVRGRVDTELEPSTPNAEGMSFDRPGITGVQLGAVLGYDAEGREVIGTMRMHGATLEYTLPEAFVQQAILPITLDPLIGARFDVSSRGTFDHAVPDAAYMAPVDYLVVFERVVGTTRQIRAAAIRQSAPPVNSLISIVTSTVGSFKPRVAPIVFIHSRFVVVWRENSDIHSASVAVGSGSTLVSPVHVVAGGSDVQINPDIGGELTSRDDDALVVWHNATANTIEAEQLVLNGNGAISSVDFTVIGSAGLGFINSSPRISNNGGPVGRYLVVWNRLFTATNSAVRGQIVDHNLTPIGGVIIITGTSEDNNLADCDGDGSHWLVAWAVNRSGSISDQDIACIPVFLDNGVGRLGGPAVVIEGDVNDDERNVSVLWLEESALIGYSDESGASGTRYDTVIDSVNPYNCAACENRRGAATALQVSSTLDSDFVAMARSYSFGSQAFIAWEERSNNRGTIVGQRFEQGAGAMSNPSGGCGSGGIAVAGCPRVGNQDFEFQLMGAQPSTPVFALLSRDPANASCGPCRIRVDLATAIVLGGTTNTSGAAFLNVPIPNDPALDGFTMNQQWAVPRAGAQCAAFMSDFSNGTVIRIGQ